MASGGHSIPGFARKRERIGHIPDTPPDSASKGLPAYGRQMMAILVIGGAIAGILSAGRSLKFLIEFCYNFSIKSHKLQFIKEIKQTIIAHMVEEEKRAKKVKPEELMSRFRSKEDLYKYLT